MSYGSGNELSMLEAALEASGMAWWWMELPSGAIFFSVNKTKMIGRSKEDFYHYTKFTDLVHPDDKKHMMQDMMDHISGKADLYETTYRIKAANGDYKRFYDRGKVVARKGNNISLAGIVMDITLVDIQKIAERTA